MITLDVAELHTVKDAAELVGVTESYIRRLCREGKIFSLKKGLIHLVSSVDVKKFANETYTVGRPRSKKPRDLDKNDVQKTVKKKAKNLTAKNSEPRKSVKKKAKRKSSKDSSEN